MPLNRSPYVKWLIYDLWVEDTLGKKNNKKKNLI